MTKDEYVAQNRLLYDDRKYGEPPINNLSCDTGKLERAFEVPIRNFRNRIKVIPLGDENGGCWKWLGAKSSGGYGMADCLVHKVVFNFYYEEAIPGDHLDHICCNASCCNPDHLRPVSRKLNLAWRYRNTDLWCKNGHPREGHAERRSNGPWRCLTCDKEYYEANRDLMLKQVGDRIKALPTRTAASLAGTATKSACDQLIKLLINGSLRSTKVKLDGVSTNCRNHALRTVCNVEGRGKHATISLKPDLAERGFTLPKDLAV